MTLLPPTPQQQASIYKKLGSDADKIAEEAEKIAAWIKENPELNINEEFKNVAFLERFFIGCKLKTNRTKETLENYWHVRKYVPEFYKNRDPIQEEFLLSIKTMYMFTLPHLSEEGYRVSICGLLDNNPEHFDATLMIKRSLMQFDIRLQEESCFGEIYIMDLSPFTLSHLKQFSISFIKKAIQCQINAMPFRIKQIHFLNASYIVKGFISVFKFFLKKKLQRRIHVHYADYTSLHKYISKRILPSDFDGEGPSIEALNDSWREKLISYREWFLKTSS